MRESGCTDMYKHKITEKYFDTVYRLALSRTKNADYADDVTQEVFLRYIKTNKSFTDEEHIKAWLITVTINCSNNVFASSWMKKTVPLSDDLTFEEQEKSDLYQTVLKLPRKYRTVIHLFYYEEMTVAQIAECLSVREGTVKAQLHRGREQLKNMLKGGAEYEF